MPKTNSLSVNTATITVIKPNGFPIFQVFYTAYSATLSNNLWT